MKVLQCWDDGVVSDVRLADLLRRQRAKATFCLNPGLYQDTRSFGWLAEGREIWRLGHAELKSVYDGFEICCHSMTHPYLTSLTSSQLDWEIKASKDLLEKIFSKHVSGFCYPFNDYNDSVLAAVRAAGYLWARGGKEEAHIFPPADPLAFSPSCHFLDPAFWGKYDRAKERSDVFFFWGHSYELHSEDMWIDFERRIEKISSDDAVEWSFVGDLFV
ncbi:Polysaccharide deacetylase [Syntrophus gentianae]|uniref:Polysaccharide deacetylase n=1 Tax=Syntrophus gentianae TaxID=43775 RepID=A0A1H7ZSG1_9BACT|nr:polysaccharide deacetylase family protein [Syntrophus gentianae]SEM60734.1 Polysaccharide deacetylase [Syntrophus gentianae]